MMTGNEDEFEKSHGVRAQLIHIRITFSTTQFGRTFEELTHPMRISVAVDMGNSKDSARSLLYSPQLQASNRGKEVLVVAG